MARVVLGLITCVAFAWLLLSLRAAVLEQQGIDASLRSRLVDQKELARAQERFAQAAKLTPDLRPKLLAAQLLAFSRRRAQGLALAHRIVAQEPDNIAAWRLIASLAAPVNPALARLARDELRRLSPPVR